nr:putative ribonuclease H-like domain-containing protein [Tanacetum cinerariifolium]
MTRNISYLSDFKEINGGYVAFGGNPKGGKIKSKGKIKTGKLDFDDVYFVKELKFNLFNVSQMCDKKNSVLFTDTECVVLSFDFKLPDEHHVLLRVPRKNNMYNVDLKNLCGMKGIKREFSVARTPQQNGVAERKNMTLIEAARTMVLVTKPHNKTPYELLLCRIPSIEFLRPFGCHVTVINTLDPLGKFDGKADDGFLSMNYQQVIAGNQLNPSTGIQENLDAVVTSQRNIMKRLKEKLKERVIAPVTAVGPNPTNSTNCFNAAGPSDNVVSPNFEIGGKSSFVDPSQYLDYPDMPALEDIIYLDNEEDVGAEVHTQEEGIDYEEVFALVARIEAIRLFLAYASFMGFMVYQMDVKSAFLYGTIKEEVYVCQPLGFEDPNYPDKVYKVVKALYGLHQAPRAWYETLANYLLETDDIIFRFTNKELCKAFEKLMKDKLQMSSMGELTFFLGLQVKQKDDGIFISQDKYVAKILRKFGLMDGKLASTPIDTKKPLLKDPDDDDMDVHIYRSMIGSLMYLTSSRPDIMFAICACAYFYVTLKVSHLHAVKRIFSDYAGAHLNRKSITGGCQFLDTYNMIAFLTKSDASEGFDQIVDFLNAHTIQYALMVNPPIYVLCIKQFWALILVKKTNDVVKLQALIDRKKVVVIEDSIRHDLRLDDADGVECLPNEEIFAELARMGYEKPLPKLTFYKASSMASAVICLATGRKFNFSKYIFDNMVRNVDSPSKFLMYLRFLQVMINAQVDDLFSHNTKYTSLALTHKVFANMRRIGKEFSRVETPLFDTMLVQPQVHDAVKVDVDDEDDNERARKLEKKRRSKSYGLKRLRKGRMEEDVTALKEINAVEPEPTVFDDEEVTMNMAQTLIKMKAEKARILDKQMAKRLQDEEIKQAAARER